MRRRANSGSKAHSPTTTTTTIEMTPSIYSSSTSQPLTRKRRTHSEMERGSAITSAAEQVTASSIDFDLIYSNSSTNSTTSGSSSNSSSNSSNNSTTSSSEDEEKQQRQRRRQDQQQQQLLLGERQSLLQQQDHDSSRPSSSSFPRIDMNHHLNIGMNHLNLNNYNYNYSMHIENIDFHNLPLEIQMALEDTLLGWNHLTSITIGHVMLPLLVFQTVKRASKYVLERTVYIWNNSQQHNNNNPMEVGNNNSNSIEAVLISSKTHFLLGLVAGIAAFRVIRHRRRVWFKHAYGSKAYRQCEEGRRRREAVLETDKRPNSLLSLSSNNNNSEEFNTTKKQRWTSKVFNNYKKKRHKKKLQRASDRFERHHTGLSPKNNNNSRSSSDSGSLSPKSSRSLNSRRRRQKLLWKDNDYDSTTSVAPTEMDYDSSSSSSEENGTILGEINKNNNSDNNNNTTCPHRSSISHDAVSIPRIHNVPYAHGGFFGAAPFFLADKRWVTILRELLPDVYVEISRRVGTSYYYSKLMGRISSSAAAAAADLDYTQDASKLIHWAENNPVVAAYGVAMDLQIKQELLLQNKKQKSNHLLSGNHVHHPSSKSMTAVGQQNSKPNKTSNQALPEIGHASLNGSIIDQFYNQSNNQNNNKHVDDGMVVAETKTAEAKTQGDHDSEGHTENDSIDIPNLEWDIFVDPQLVRRVEAVLDAMHGYIASKTGKNTSNDITDKEFGNSVSTKTMSASTTTDPLNDNGESKTDCDTCTSCNKSGIDNENENGNSFDDEDSGNSEAAALLADHDHNISNNPIGINNLCGTNPADLCGSCFQTDESAGVGMSSRNNNADFLVVDDSSPVQHHGQQQYDAEEIGHQHLSNDPVLRYLERELEKRTQELTDRLLIAHGNVLQLVMEQAGVLKDWNYSRVQRTRRTLGGGMYARQWMAVFAESLRLGMKKPRKGCKKNKRSKAKTTTTTMHNFYDDDREEDNLGEMDALLPLVREKQHELFETEEDNSFDDENDDDYEDIEYDDDEDYDDLLERDRYDPLEDDHNHCTCSPRCCLDFTLEESVKLIERITQTKQPIGILLDLKSRHVPKRVLNLMVRSLQAAGIRVVGIASFEISDIRGVCSSHPHDIVLESGSSNSNNNNNFASKIPLGIKAPISSTKEILMVHSAGDLQAACDEGLVRPGDHVFFNGGSLILDSARSSTLKSLLGFFFDMCVCGLYNTFDPCAIEDGYRIHSYGYACSSMDAMETAECFASETRNLMERSCNGSSPHQRRRRSSTFGLHHHEQQYHNNAVDMNNNMVKDDDDDTLLMSSQSSSDEETEMGAVMKTLADYKKHYGFSMGLYLQEFSIDEAAARLLIDLVNENPELYDLGLAWGGINGMTVHGIQPGRFTSTDGYWNQRRLGKSWKNPF